jgi:hypothetical protein
LTGAAAPATRRQGDQPKVRITFFLGADATPASYQLLHATRAAARPVQTNPTPPMAAALLTPTQRYAAGALLALALRQAQIHQSVLLGAPSSAAPDDERASSASGSSSGGIGEDAADDAGLWTHDSRGLLRPVFRFAPNIDCEF